MTKNTLITFQEASQWATEYLGKKVDVSNISYLTQYGVIEKITKDGSTFISKEELESYYQGKKLSVEKQWLSQIEGGVNWDLSFDKYSEAETTKHVHRLHPYKGKFIPQLVEYFLDSNTDDFKKEALFNPGDTILDPFCGSGTTLVQANELGINAIGVDVSDFNTLISNAKLGQYNLTEIEHVSAEITAKLKFREEDKQISQFIREMREAIKAFNNTHFPSPDYRRKVRQGAIDEKSYSKSREIEASKICRKLINKYEVDTRTHPEGSFLDQWFIEIVKAEIQFALKQVNQADDLNIRRMLKVILSRTARSCRATRHADLGTLKTSQTGAYYCRKHGKICVPLFSIVKWWKSYSKDTIERLREFSYLRTSSNQICLTGDSRNINILDGLKIKHPSLGEIVKTGIDGIFTSPPYVGLIDYHEQHAYAYDLFGLARNDEAEIGPLYSGQGKAAQQSYVEGISQVLRNCVKYLKPGFNVFIVANDKYKLYPQIAEKSKMVIVGEHKRPVLNRMEKSSAAYSESIFHLKAFSNIR